MAKPPDFLEKPLDWVFSTPSSVAVLRSLRDSKEGMSGRAVAREGGINHQTCALTVIRLESLGLVKRQGSGKTRLISLNFDHFLIQEVLLPLLRKEREMAARIRRDIAGGIGEQALSTTLFGSAARGGSVPGSDVDLLVIAPPEAKTGLVKKAEDFSREFMRRYGIRLAPIVMTVREAKNRAGKADPLLGNILREGIDLGAGKLREVLK
ncbi:MAG: nucleotidyltransferase domain-containing protein [Elusimicrobia bacterium]|nr:nucleotidyltransferase domain-containing protein [Elusimicrobiota bacterium]